MAKRAKLSDAFGNKVSPSKFASSGPSQMQEIHMPKPAKLPEPVHSAAKFPGVTTGKGIKRVRGL